MSVTNLKGTKWIFRSSIGFSNFNTATFSINFIAGGSEPSSSLSIDKTLSPAAMKYGDSIAYQNGWRGVEDPQYAVSRMIEIIDGTDITNQTLISFLESQAYQVPVLNLAGTKWIFNDTLSLSMSAAAHYLIYFRCNGDTYSELLLNYYKSSGNYIYQEGRVYCYSSEFQINIYVNQSFANNIYKTIRITSGSDCNNINLILWLSQNATNIPIKTYDLLNLDKPDGTYEMKVKARANGFGSSNFSNKENYTVQTIIVFNNINISLTSGGRLTAGYRKNDGSWQYFSSSASDTRRYVESNVTKLEVYADDGSDSSISMTTAGGVTIPTNIPLGEEVDITQYLQDGCYIDIIAKD